MTTPHLFTAHLESEDAGFPAPGDLPILIAAEQAGFMMASSCRNGTCRTCLCRLRRGRVSYRIEWPGLSAEEKSQNYILPCIAYPLTDLVIADSDSDAGLAF